MELDALKAELTASKAREKMLEEKNEFADSKLQSLRKAQESLGMEAADWKVEGWHQDTTYFSPY